MAKIERDLGQLFENNFDCYTLVERGSCELDEEIAMSRDKFVRLVSDLLTEANKI